MIYRHLAAAVLDCLREPDPGEECVELSPKKEAPPQCANTATAEAQTARGKVGE